MRWALMATLVLLSPAATAAEGLRPVARPANRGAAEMAALTTPVAPGDAAAPMPAVEPPAVGPETGLPLPRYVSLKPDEANVRRGPGGDHRIDWVFVRRAMPLRVTAEHGNWRRVEDADGEGGWVHYSLLSGTRTALVLGDVALRRRPDDGAFEVAQVQAGVVASLEECDGGWCRIAAGGYEGWVRDTAIWGVDPGEVFE